MLPVARIAVINGRDAESHKTNSRINRTNQIVCSGTTFSHIFKIYGVYTIMGKDKNNKRYNENFALL